MSSLRDQSGQALLELSLSLAMVVPLIVGSAVLLRLHWEQTACSRAVFEATRARLEGRFERFSRFHVAFEDAPGSVTGFAVCVGKKHRVELPRLEVEIISGEPNG